MPTTTRAGSPPTAYRGGLQPVGPRDLKELHRRASRTDLDFESALKSEGTVVLKEGLDVNTLGVEHSPSASPSASSHYTPLSTPTVSSAAHHTNKQPSTPTVVPPTPASAPVAGPSSPKLSNSSPILSQMHDPFYDTDDADRTVNRRSMYRSPGTASSPDLATLLRKAKEKGGTGMMGIHGRDKRRESPPPLPPLTDCTSHGLTSPRYPTSPQPSPLPPRGKAKSQRMQQSNSSEWVLAGLQNGSPTKPTKSSVRSKASTFLGKMLGQNTVRERSKTDAGNYNPGGLADAFCPPPPVPALPSEYLSTPQGSPIADAYSSSPPTNSRSSSPSSKPLPPIRQHFEPGDGDDRSMVFVEKPPITPTPESRKVDANLTIKRRSMSVGDAELQRIMASTMTTRPLPQTPEVSRKLEQVGPEDTTLNGILNDFKGELSQLDPSSLSPLQLRDPSTPSRRGAYLRSKTDSIVLPSGQGSTRSSSLSSVSSPMPTVTLSQTDAEEATDEPPPIVPPRSTSLQSTPARSHSGSFSSTSRLSPVRSRSGHSFALPPPSSSRNLRVLHRSTASSSEPSLIPIEDTRLLTRAPAASQQDLHVTDLGLSSFPTRSSRVIDDPDVDMRAQELATKCWMEDEEFLSKDKIAEWLGGTGQVNKAALQYYMDFFDFSGLRLDMAFRRLCAKLYLKGETQQVDRILETFSGRYWDCNPGGVYGSANIVHAVSYSLLLLNTDLHVADLTTRMSRNQFVRNTLTAIQTQLQPSFTQMNSPDMNDDDGSLRAASSEGTDRTARSKRSDSITSWNSISRDTVLSSPAMSLATTQVTTPGTMSNDSSPSMQMEKPVAPSSFYGRNWETNMESLLKEMYNAIKNQQILQPLSASRSSLSTPGGGAPLRNRSLRGQQPDRLTAFKRGSIRGIQSLMGQGYSPYSSNSSIDGRVSPSPSFVTSMHEPYGSSSSFLSPTLGFASNLSHTIIRETQEDDDRSDHSAGSTNTSISITDEELALLGAPWAKEGMLCRKQYWESQGKRSKDKAWMDVFVVIQKGELNMFTFGENGAGSSSVVGGGNWLSNATPVGTVQLSHSLAHALPSPGYSRQRPYCMVLTLANGGVYFFQAGTEELVNEWVSTCNYWAARTSKEPLAGGVSNMEYGWNRVTDPVHGRSVSDSESMRDDSISIRSGKSARSKFGWQREGAATVRATSSPWADRIFINDWKPPMHPTVSSMHDEETQLEALRKHVKAMKRDLQRHNELREPMASLYQPRTNNSIKAQSNWEKKSQWLLTEIVKYDSYIDSLQSAMSLRFRKRGEKALERALNGNSNGSDDARWKGTSPHETIHETDEPTTPSPAAQESGSRLHRRETAEDDG